MGLARGTRRLEPERLLDWELVGLRLVRRGSGPAAHNLAIETQLDVRICQRFRRPNRVSEYLARNGFRRLFHYNRKEAGGQIAAIIQFLVRDCPLAHGCGSSHTHYSPQDNLSRPYGSRGYSTALGGASVTSGLAVVDNLPLRGVIGASAASPRARWIG